MDGILLDIREHREVAAVQNLGGVAAGFIVTAGVAVNVN